MEQLIDIERTWWIVISCLITTILGFIIGDLRLRLSRERVAREEAAAQEKKESEQLLRAMRYMLKGNINQECSRWLENGYCPTRSREVLIEQRDIYHDLGGNSFVSSLVADTLKLPITKGDK